MRWAEGMKIAETEAFRRFGAEHKTWFVFGKRLAGPVSVIVMLAAAALLVHAALGTFVLTIVLGVLGVILFATGMAMKLSMHGVRAKMSGRPSRPSTVLVATGLVLIALVVFATVG